MRYIEEPPPVAGYAALRAVVGWSALPPEAVKAGLEAALYSVSVYDGERLIGCGRVVGDGGLYFYIQDIIVHPDYQGRKVGEHIMEGVMAYLENNARANAFIGLMAAVGVERFYHRYGFERRPDDRPGMFRIWDADA